jgi:DNA-directed RNA polymerase specialized sigma24 family protein
MSSEMYLRKAQAMRSYLVNQAKSQYDIRSHGGEPLMSADELLALDAAITRLHEEYPEHAIIALMRFFTELTVDEIAEILSIKKATVERRWRLVRVYLRNCRDERPGDTIYVQAWHIDLIRSLAANLGSGDSDSGSHEIDRNAPSPDR